MILPTTSLGDKPGSCAESWNALIGVILRALYVCIMNIIQVLMSGRVLKVVPLRNVLFSCHVILYYTLLSLESTVLCYMIRSYVSLYRVALTYFAISQ